MQIPQDKQRNSWVWFVHSTLSQGCISCRLPVSLCLHKPNGRQECSPVFLSPAKAVPCPRAAWKAAAAPVCTEGGAEPQAAQGSCPNTRSTDLHEPAESRHSRYVQLVTFCLEQGALTPTETRSGLDASCKVQEPRVLMHNAAHRPSLATEETCHVMTPSTRRTLPLSTHPLTLSWSQKTGQKKKKRQGREVQN